MSRILVRIWQRPEGRAQSGDCWLFFELCHRTCNDFQLKKLYSRDRLLLPSVFFGSLVDSRFRHWLVSGLLLDVEAVKNQSAQSVGLRCRACTASGRGLDNKDALGALTI